jgi:hypothetical protein
MMTLILEALTHPSHLYWWQWGKILGIFLLILYICLDVKHPLLVALAVHVFVDFTAQSDQTAARKKQGNRVTLAYHAFIAGGYSGLVAGGLPGLVISIASHFLVDVTNKFGLKSPTGPALDQAAHVLTLTTIWWLL